MTGKQCSVCKHPKPLTSNYFYFHVKRKAWSSACIECRCIQNSMYQKTKRGKKATKRYRNRPEVKARRSEQDKARYEAEKVETGVRQKVWRATPFGKLLKGRQNAIQNLQRSIRSGNDGSRSRATLESYNAEISRYMEKRKDV